MAGKPFSPTLAPAIRTAEELLTREIWSGSDEARAVLDRLNLSAAASDGARAVLARLAAGDTPRG